MKRHSAALGPAGVAAIAAAVVVAATAIALAFGTGILAQGPSDGNPAGTATPSQQDAALACSDGNPCGTPEVLIPDPYRPRAGGDTSAAAPASAAVVYFTPQDENSSTTVLFLYNTGAVTGTVDLHTYQLDGSTYIHTSVAVPPSGLVRICGDAVSAPDAATWQDVVVVNFTTYSTYAKMTLPAGVKATGHVVWNGGGTYNPNQVVPALPLRFSADPDTVFLPQALKDP